MKIYLIRHGETDWNKRNIIQGSNDTILNDIGRKQACELAKKMHNDKNICFTKVYTSKQKRAVETAKIISEALDKKYIIVDGLQEMDLGSFENHTWDEAKKKFSYEFSLWMKNRRYKRVPCGESYQDVLVRALDALKKIIESNSENVAVVTHGAVIMAILCLLSKTSFDDILKFSTLNTSICEIDSKSVLEYV